jgi:hypothetical protein
VQQPTGSRSAKISAESPINSKRCGGQQELPNTEITRRHLLPPAPGYKLASYTVWSPTPDGESSDGFPDEKKKFVFLHLILPNSKCLSKQSFLKN